MPTPVRNSADFKGLLLQRRQRPGQKYVLLLFRTEAGLRFGLTKNIELVKTLQIGHKYRVQGNEHTVGHKTYLNMTSVIEVGSKRAVFTKRFGLVASAASLLLIVGTVGTGLLMSHNSAKNSQSDTSSDLKIQKEESSSNSGTTDKLDSILNQKKSSLQTSQNNKSTSATRQPAGNSDAVSPSMPDKTETNPAPPPTFEPTQEEPVVPVEPTTPPPTPEPTPEESDPLVTPPEQNMAAPEPTPLPAE